jgi:hypothetical protein
MLTTYRYLSNKTLCVSLLGLLCAVVPISEADARQPPAKDRQQQQQTLTAAEAAARAKAQHGGKVLKVSPQGKAFRVKLLTDSGRVITVTIKD